MNGDHGDRQLQSLLEPFQGAVGLAQHRLLKLCKLSGRKADFATGVLRAWLTGPSIPEALKDVLHRALGNPETLSDLPHGLAVFHTCGHDTLAKVQ